MIYMGKYKKKRTTKFKYKGGEGETEPFIPTTYFILKQAIQIYIRDRNFAIERYGIMNTWNVSQITNMENLFANLETFNEYINDWDVSNVTKMTGMFYGAVIYNQPLSKWNVSNVTDMEGMFQFARSFNQPLNEWNVSNVQNMYSMFSHAIKFNQPLYKWNVSNVRNMKKMFYSAIQFNQNLRNWNITTPKHNNMFYMTKMWSNNYPGNYLYTRSNLNLFHYDDDDDDDSDYDSDSEEELEDDEEPNRRRRRIEYTLENTNLSRVYEELRPSIQQTKTPLLYSKIKINTSDQITDYISGDNISIKELLNNPINIIFYFQDKPSFFITRQQIIEHLPEFIRFGCHNISTTILPQVENLERVAYVSLRSIGFPLGGGLIPLYELNNTLYSTIAYCLEIVETDKSFPSVASLQMLTQNANAVSAAHCQQGQSERVYGLKQIMNSNQSAGKRTIKNKTYLLKTKKYSRKRRYL